MYAKNPNTWKYFKLQKQNNYSVMKNLVPCINYCTSATMHRQMKQCNNFTIIKLITFFNDDIFTSIYDKLIIAINFIIK